MRRPSRQLDLALQKRTLPFESVEHDGAQNRIAGKNFSYGVAQKFSTRPAQETLDRSADQHHAQIAGKQHQAVLQLGHELVHVVFQRRKNFLRIAHLAAEVGNFEGHQAVFIVARLVVGERGVASAHAVEVAVDGLQRAEREIRNSCRQKQRHEDRCD